jgi:valyl-tRNA synthetase
MDIPKQYNPADSEDKMFKLWLEKGLFHSDSSKGGEPFSIVIPPPNVTGILHMGHALNNTIQDVIIRWKRLQGCNALWMCGTDHAGIATQNVVEKQLAREGTGRWELGREKFIERVWQWKEHHGSVIIDQLKKLGCMLDWERERFTMDDGLSDAVREVFIKLYDKGLIYRGNYIINWCSHCRTALSDEEAQHQEVEGKLYYLKYPVEESDEPVIVATTRPETMLGDVAVALNPDDKRFAGLKNKNVILPLLNRKLEVIADTFVDPKFGTGIVKVTPAHDPNDFMMGQRHNLAPINVMNEDGTMNENAGPYQGLDRSECRAKLLKDLESRGLVQKIQKHTHSIGHCYRCDTVVEPRLSLQWFVKMKPLAQPAIDVVKDEKIKFHPPRWTRVYLDWMENIRDWCISRQIWWGHRLPIYYCGDCDEIMAAKTAPEQCVKCSSTKITQDEDVLDTWFSSWLWPFSTFGWPDNNEDLKFYYPTNVLSTAPEIIFFWVARMIMAGLEFVGDIPFSDVYIHGTVRDDTGTKMSKSLGNTIDPIDIINEFGADALRFSIIMITSQGQDVFLSKEKFEIGRNFANKIWNASRFLLTATDGFKVEPVELTECELSSDDIYILGRLNQSIKRIDDSLAKFRLNEAASEVYDFFWHHYCDRYIEYAKNLLYGDDENDKRRTATVLLHILKSSMKLLHPFMPYITEQIWQILQPEEASTVIESAWPALFGPELDQKIIDMTEQKYELIRFGRNLRAEYNVAPSKNLKFFIKALDQDAEKYLLGEKESIVTMIKASDLQISASYDPSQPMPSAVTPLGTIYLSLEGEVDTAAEAGRLEKQLEKLLADLKRIRAKLRKPEFLENAPAAVIQKQKEKEEELTARKNKIERSLSFIKQ